MTTPQAAAQRVAQRSAFAARRLKLSVRGVIENMSWFTGDDGKRYELFGAGGGATLAADLGVPCSGRSRSSTRSAGRRRGSSRLPPSTPRRDGEASRAIAEKLAAWARPVSTGGT